MAPRKTEKAVATPLEIPEHLYSEPSYGAIHDAKVLDQIAASLLRIEKLLAKKP